MSYKIVVVEDEDSNLLYFQALAQNLGYEIRCYSDAETFLKKTKIHDYDLLIADWSMPVMSGLELCQRVKEINNKIPIIICSAYAMESDRQIALEVADDYLAKPFRKNQFIEIVEKWCKRN